MGDCFDIFNLHLTARILRATSLGTPIGRKSSDYFSLLNDAQPSSWKHTRVPLRKFYSIFRILLTDLGQRKNSTLLKKVFEVLRSHGSLPPHFDAAALANVEKEHKAEV